MPGSVPHSLVTFWASVGCFGLSRPPEMRVGRARWFSVSLRLYLQDSSLVRRVGSRVLVPSVKYKASQLPCEAEYLLPISEVL